MRSGSIGVLVLGILAIGLAVTTITLSGLAEHTLRGITPTVPPALLPTPVPTPVPAIVTPTPIPTPVPTPIPSQLPVPATGLLCTWTAADFGVVDPACLINYTDINMTACEEIRNSSNFNCDRTRCFALIAQLLPNNESFFTVGGNYVDEPTLYGFVTLIGSNDGPVYIMQMVSQFVTDNIPNATHPVVPEPQPYEETVNFTQADWNVNSMQIPSREFAREVLAALMNYYALLNESAMTPPAFGSDVFDTFNTLAYTPLRCQDAELVAIPWVVANNVSVGMALAAYSFLTGLNVTASDFDGATWSSTSCDYWTSSWTIFCAQFPDYYTYESLRNFSIVPSPWADMTTLARVWNEEYRNCGEPVGCMGVESPP